MSRIRGLQAVMANLRIDVHEVSTRFVQLPPTPRPLRHDPTSWRAYSTRRDAAERDLTPMESMLASRAHLRSRLPTEQVKVTGVSFEGRQANVAQLLPGQALAFVKEPENAYDPHAVAVTTLDAVPLGYVPRERTQAFVHSVCFGKVLSVGKAASGLWGCSADVQPKMPPLVVLPVPETLKRRLHVAEYLSGTAWEHFCAGVLERSGSRCTISAAPTEVVTERWDFDVDARVIRLTGFAAQAPEVTHVQYMLESGEDLRGELAAANAWDGKDVERYVGWVSGVQQRFSEMEWTVDLSVLNEIGVEVPARLEEFMAR